MEIAPYSFLKSNADISFTAGELQSVDGYMNIALEKTEEWVNGQKRRTYGDAFVRGNNGNSLSSPLVSVTQTLTDQSVAVMYISAES